MRELTAVIWNLAFMYTCRIGVDAASRNGEVSTSTGKGSYSKDTNLPNFGAKQDANRATWSDDAFSQAGLPPPHNHGSNVPRKLSMHPRPGTNEFGHTALSWGDRDDDDEEPTNVDSGYGESVNTDTSSAFTPTGSRRSPESPSQRSSLSEASASGTSSSFNVSSSSIAGTVSQRRESDPGASTVSSTAGTRTSAERLLEDARAFVTSAATANATGEAQTTESGKQGLLKFTHVDERVCKIAIFFGAAKAARDMGAVDSIREVKVNNFTEEVELVFDERSSIHAKGFWKRQRAVIRKAVGAVKQKLRNVNIGLPPGCTADQSSRYYIFFKDPPEKSESSRVESVVISLNFKVAPFRVARTLHPRKTTETPSTAPNDWIRRRDCSWSVEFSRYLTHAPVLRIDRVTGRATFDNTELKDLSKSLADDQMSCDWTSPLLCKVHVSSDTRKDPPNWRVQLDLSLRTDQMRFIQQVKLGNDEDAGMPADLSGRGTRAPRRGSWQKLVE